MRERSSTSPQLCFTPAQHQIGAPESLGRGQGAWTPGSSPCCREQGLLVPPTQHGSWQSLVSSLGSHCCMVAHGPQTRPPASLISTNSGTPAPQHCHSSPCPPHPNHPVSLLPPATCPWPLALTIRHCRSLAPSRCLHCPRCLRRTRRLSQHRCPRGCTCRSLGAAARGAQGAGACRAGGRSCRSPQRVWWPWGETRGGLCQSWKRRRCRLGPKRSHPAARNPCPEPAGVARGTFEGWLGAQGCHGHGVTQPGMASRGPGAPGGGCLGFPSPPRTPRWLPASSHGPARAALPTRGHPAGTSGTPVWGSIPACPTGITKDPGVGQYPRLTPGIPRDPSVGQHPRLTPGDPQGPQCRAV